MSSMSENLFDEVDSMLEVSSLIYDLATLNNWDDTVGKGKINDPSFLKTLPRKSSEVTAWFKSNREILAQVNESDSKTKFKLDFDQQALDRILSRDDIDSSGEATLEVLDDNFAFKGKKSELVYAITRNPDKKRLTVIFRGSQARKDWEQNFKFNGEDVELSSKDWSRLPIPSPNQEVFKDFEEARIHSGFYEYLFELQQKDDQTTKFTEIMKELSTRLMDPINKDYSVYFTGHSLGAALATLAAAATAISDSTNKPIRLITFASPHVGKQNFVDAFKKLEMDGRIQHIRVTNEDDAVPQALGFLGYKHTGIHLNCRDPSWFNKKTYSISQTHTRGFFTWTNNMNFTFAWLFGGVVKYHSLEEHRERLVAGKEDLEQKTIDGLYADPSLRGY